MSEIENKIIDNDAGIIEEERSGSVVDIFDYYSEKAVEELEDDSFRMDIGTGFLFFSGFQEAHDSFQRLVDADLLSNVDEEDWGSDAPIRAVMGQKTDFYTKNVLTDLVKDGISSYDDDTVDLLETMVQEDLIDFRVIKDKQFHPKIYSFYLKSDIPDDIWSGSANFSRSGLRNNIELCTPMQATMETRENFREWFDNLWEQGTEDLDVLEIIEEVEESDFLYYSPRIFFSKIISMLDKQYLLEKAPGVQDDLLLEFQNLTYNIVMNRLQNYGGYILANSVGTGKTYVACQTASTYLRLNPGRRVLVVSPSNIVDDWRETLEEFEIEDQVDIESRGILQKPPRSDEEADSERKFDERKYADQYDLIIVDEAHSYRNTSNRRENLEEIIKSNSDADVLLTSATPINLSPNDLFQLIDLFRSGKRIEKFEGSGMNDFYLDTRRRFKKLDNYNDLDTDLLQDIKEIEDEFSIKITWRVIQREFEDDLRELAGDDVEYEDPEVKEIGYDYPDDVREKIFNEVIPFLDELYYEPAKLWAEREYKEDTNLIFLHKWRIYKRLESSIAAFHSSIKRLYVRNKLYYTSLQNKKALEDGELSDLMDSKGELEEIVGSDRLSRLVNQEAGRRSRMIETYEDLDEDLGEKVIDRIKKDTERTKKMLDLVEEHTGSEEKVPREGDTKVEELVELVEENLEEDKPTLIFSEYIPTVEYLEEVLSQRLEEHADKIEGIHGQTDRSKKAFVRRFQEGDIDVAISTDMLSEGVNIPRADVVVNYDLPYNPTKLIQRTGRALRITNPKKIEVRNFTPEDSVNKEIELYEKLDARLNSILQIAGLDFIIWMMDEKKIQELHEEEKQEYLNHLEEYKDRISTDDPENVSGSVITPQETKNDRILRKAIEAFDINENLLDNLSTPKSADAKTIFTVLEPPEEESETLSAIGHIGGNTSIWESLEDSVTPNPDAPERRDGLTDNDKTKLDSLKEEKEEDFKREQTAKDYQGRETEELLDKLREASELLEDSDMREVCSRVRKGLENRSYTNKEISDIEEAIDYILQEDFSLMKEPDSVIQESEQWRRLNAVASREEGEYTQAKIQAVVKYQNNTID
ncbi:MAG: helicase-related protein [Candidatus Nanosalina sp.]